MEGFVSIALAALLVEAVVNIIENIKEGETSWKYWSALGASILLSVVVAVNWNIDLFVLAGFPGGTIPLLGPILTGLIVSRGSNVVSDLIGLINR